MADATDTANVIVRPPIGWAVAVFAGLALNWLLPLPFIPAAVPAGGLGTMVFALALAAAIPGVWPPITIKGERYIDGGVRSMLNADLATGCDIVIGVSCFALEVVGGIKNPDMATEAASTTPPPTAMGLPRSDGSSSCSTVA
jgi:hypothetical protein